MLAVVFPLTVLHVRLLASLDHPEKLSLALVAGGASLVGGIIFLLAPRRRRPRRSDERRSLADGAFATTSNLGSPGGVPSAQNSLSWFSSRDDFASDDTIA